MENNDQLQAFLKANLKSNLAKLAFKKTLVKGYDNRFVLNQLYGKQKAKNKFTYGCFIAALIYAEKLWGQ